MFLNGETFAKNFLHGETCFSYEKHLFKGRRPDKLMLYGNYRILAKLR
jgi:hypothetical protein